MFFLISGEDNAWKTPKYGEKPDKIGLFGQIVAERVGFEPTVPLQGSQVFKTSRQESGRGRERFAVVC
jgi:hypothetical protein